MELHIKGKVVSIHDKMEVLDENDQVVYRVSSKALSIHNKTYIEDAAGNEVAYIHAKAISIHHRYYVEMVDGESFGLSEELFHVHDIVDIDALGWQLRGTNILAFDFEVTDQNGSVIATAHRKFVSMHGIYNLTVIDESQADKIVALFVVMRHIIEQREISEAETVNTPHNKG